MRRLLPALLALFVLTAPEVHAAPVPEGAEWFEDTITEEDGTQLHVDILRPAGLPENAKTPVILSIGPYFNHSGQVGAVGPVQGEGYDPISPSEGPSGRFHDLIEGARLMERGYTFVMVDLRGFGGSTGCLDWGGPGEQADVKAAVTWAAAQPWSNGKVGMYGKSYDGVTGLIGAVNRVPGLAAVVAQEPVYDLYRYLYSNGVRYQNSAATPGLYDAIAATPGPILDDPVYNLASAGDGPCGAINYASQQNNDPTTDYWKVREFITRAKDTTVPVFLTQGYLENNTKPDGAWDFYNNLQGPKRGWFGMWDHVRGNDTDESGRLLMGREGFFDEVMRWYDHYLRDVPLADAPVHKDPPNAIQTSDGTWRSEAQWPPADATALDIPLRAGAYADDGLNNGSGSSGTGTPVGQGYGDGIWTISPPLPHDVHLAGVGRAELDLTIGAPNANVVVDVYSIDPENSALLLTRGTSLVAASGKVGFDLLGNDWKIPAGHRIGVLVTGSNAEWWVHAPTNQDVTVNSAGVRLPFLRHTRPDTLPGEPSVRLDVWTSDAPFTLEQSRIDEGTDPGFPIPAAQVPAPPATDKPSRARGKRVKVRIARKGRRVTVYGNAPAKAKLSIRLKRGKRTVATRKVRTRVNAFRVTFKVRRGGRYRAVVKARKGGRRFSARSKRVRVR